MCCSHDGRCGLHWHGVVVGMAEAIALVVMVTIGLIAALEFYDRIHPIGANVSNRRMYEYTMLIQADLTCFTLMIW